MVIMLTIPVILQAAYVLALLLGSSMSLALTGRLDKALSMLLEAHALAAFKQLELFRVFSDIKGPFRGLFLLP
ncbi:hypothetical protein AM355_10470 [Klebsiella oxytoca]|uniref:Uncharacterized protein n=1 Tax=Klebsiella michiganensis (strain ATCC 8724 / DSM 4798 / JCM 20051 / NBRC 3318 / NRRL B-199 / KCTC 1686 / BUCSAV 143 / CCM 1901) TaxID=1006551 RepID=A0A0H3HDE2_KLEM8|nr:hypothetical protein KOX_18975 [Klebsiella michiganensis KCTC 1686]AHW89170.1 hypothetical protein J415_18660 [Klebsiella michiganensis HKOPL1]AVE77614.1 hypothetical protein AM355_10470 [Klebsiella oxytoca]KFC36668.1 hypothetical protein FF19_21280 [Klebsiella michiganensis]